MSGYPIVDLSTDALLTTTRSVRKRLDLTKPVPIGLIRECLEIAVQAPTSANVQNWSFIVVTDVEQRRAIGDVYCRTWDLIVASPFAVADRFKDDPARNREQRKVSDSAAYLAEHIGEVPVLMIPCVEVIDGDGTLTGENANQYWSSIMPAAWSYMLAARSRGLGTTWTGVTVMADDEMRAILGLPDNVYHDHPHRLLHRHDLPPCQTDSARRRFAFRPVVSGPPKPTGGPVTREHAKYQGGQPWTAITTTRAPITP